MSVQSPTIAPASVPAEPTRNPFASVNFQLWWFASVFAGAGVGIQTAIVPLFIRDRVATDQRAAAIGLELIAANLVGALLALVGGVAADRVERRRILVRTYAVTTSVATIYVLLSALDVRIIWPVYILAACVGAAGAFTNPARQSMVPQMLTRAQMQNGVILGNMAFLAMLQFGGPAIGGLLSATAGLPVAFGIEVGCLGVGAFLFSRIATDTPMPTGKTVFGDLKDGLRYVRTSPSLTGLLVLGTIPGMFIMGPFAVTIVLMVEDVFQASDAFVGLLWACFGGGILLGSVLMTLRRLPRRGLWACTSILSGGTAFLAYAFSESLPLSMVIVVILGVVGPALFINTVVALLQENARPEMMGRVMSMYSLAFTASGPLGFAWAAIVASVWGPQAALRVGATCCVVLGLACVLFLKPVRRLN